jgi:response regulator of citrate/malate metabolism
MRQIVPEVTQVLIVDDNIQYSQILTRMLRSIFGFQQITHFDNLEDAKDFMAEQGPLASPSEPSQLALRLLFIDYHFPGGKTGGSLIRELSERKLLEGRICFLITSEPSVENMREAQLAGAVGIIAKPFDRAELTRQLDKADRLLEIGQGEDFSA